MSDTDMNDETAKAILSRLDEIETKIGTIEGKMGTIEGKMVTKADVFQSVLTVHGFAFVIIVGVIVVLNAINGLA